MDTHITLWSLWLQQRGCLSSTFSQLGHPGKAAVIERIQHLSIKHLLSDWHCPNCRENTKVGWCRWLQGILVELGAGGNGRAANKGLKSCWTSRMIALDMKTTVCLIWLSTAGERHTPSDMTLLLWEQRQSWRVQVAAILTYMATYDQPCSGDHCERARNGGAPLCPEEALRVTPSLASASPGAQC